jgi:hypothetical protein
MDPNANLERQRELAQTILDAPEVPDAELSQEASQIIAAADELAGLVQALDEWRRNGGFDPYGG